MADAEDPIMQDPAPVGTVEVEVATEPVADSTVEAAPETEPVGEEAAVSAATVNAIDTISGEANPSTTDTAIATDTATAMDTGVTTTVDTATTTNPILPEEPLQEPHQMKVDESNSNEAQLQVPIQMPVEGDLEGLALTKEEAEYRDAAMAMDISGSAEPAALGEAEAEAQPPADGEELSTDAIQIWGPADPDVLSGRGASVNAHPGNKKFRALCFSRKQLFEAGNHAAKRRIAMEIVQAAVTDFGARFLKRKEDKGPWYEMNEEQALLKACQVMRDHKRPDRLAQREMMAAHGKKRNRATSTPMDDVPVVPVPEEQIAENPFGVHDHDILCGRGAFVNGHIGNARLRDLAHARKKPFDNGNYTEKRTLAMEVVTIIRSLDPPGRFLKRVDLTKTSLTPAPVIKAADDTNKSDEPDRTLQTGWEELSDEKAIHKACQVMRDIDRADRKDREERRKMRKLKKDGKLPETLQEGAEDGDMKPEEQDQANKQEAPSDPMEILAETTVVASQVVEEAVAAAEEAMDKALEAAAENSKAAPVEEIEVENTATI